ncbi:hypothetical protein BC826DRAFT_570284 [Russula brevipes]|nr:hypothetical protein BC826DRAFT_570284 [Russula brevipes]
MPLPSAYRQVPSSVLQQVRYFLSSLDFISMAVVATSIHSSSYTFTAPRDGAIAFHRDQYHRPAVSHHNPFEAFAPHRHSTSPSRSSAASWRRSEAVAQVAPPKRQQSGQSHSHTSSASETPSTNWHPRTCSPAVTRVDVTQKPSGEVLILEARPHSTQQLTQMPTRRFPLRSFILSPSYFDFQPPLLSASAMNLKLLYTTSLLIMCGAAARIRAPGWVALVASVVPPSSDPCIRLRMIRNTPISEPSDGQLEKMMTMTMGELTFYDIIVV